MNTHIIYKNKEVIPCCQQPSCDNKVEWWSDCEPRWCFVCEKCYAAEELEEAKANQDIPKRTLTIECRCCGDMGFYEDIRDDRSDDEPDYEYGMCYDCEEEQEDQKMPKP